MRSLLVEGGRFFLSFPIGYNPSLDQAAFDGRLGFKTIHYLQRVSEDNRWVEVSLAVAKTARYGDPFPCANALFVGID
jgi:hypothetical protein